MAICRAQTKLNNSELLLLRMESKRSFIFIFCYFIYFIFPFSSSSFFFLSWLKEGGNGRNRSIGGSTHRCAGGGVCESIRARAGLHVCREREEQEERVRDSQLSR